MKKLLSSLPIILALICFTQSSLSAQDRPFQVGAGLIFGSEVEELGIQANVNYPITQNIEFAPDVSIYFIDDESGIDNYWELNANGHYFFTNKENYNVYGLAGLNVTTASYNFIDDSDTEAGINVGVGSEYYLQAFSVYGEIKYVISNFDQLVLGAGVRIPF